MLVEVLKVKEHSVGAIFFALTNTLEIISLEQCPVGSITRFDESFFISASIMVASVVDLLQLGKNYGRGFVSKSILNPITVERISLSDVIVRQAGKECAMHPAVKVSQ